MTIDRESLAHVIQRSCRVEIDAARQQADWYMQNLVDDDLMILERDLKNTFLYQSAEFSEAVRELYHVIAEEFNPRWLVAVWLVLLIIAIVFEFLI